MDYCWEALAAGDNFEVLPDQSGQIIPSINNANSHTCNWFQPSGENNLITSTICGSFMLVVELVKQVFRISYFHLKFF